jgi:hypothetical protein
VPEADHAVPREGLSGPRERALYQAAAPDKSPYSYRLQALMVFTSFTCLCFLQTAIR